MSMLTPPEMGGPYRIKGNKYPRMRRNRRRRRVFVVLGAMLAVALVGFGTLQLVDVFSDGGGKSPAAAAGGADCRQQSAKSGGADAGTGGDAAGAEPAPELPEPAGVTVNVLNATTRTGLAQDTADELKKRGFKIGKVANAPAAYDKKLPGPGLLLGSAAAEEGALKVLGTQLERAQTKTDGRDGKAVDLIIGSGFRELTASAEARKSLSALAKPSPSPSPSCR